MGDLTAKLPLAISVKHLIPTTKPAYGNDLKFGVALKEAIPYCPNEDLLKVFDILLKRIEWECLNRPQILTHVCSILGQRVSPQERDRLINELLFHQTNQIDPYKRVKVLSCLAPLAETLEPAIRIHIIQDQAQGMLMGHQGFTMDQSHQGLKTLFQDFKRETSAALLAPVLENEELSKHFPHEIQKLQKDFGVKE